MEILVGEEEFEMTLEEYEENFYMQRQRKDSEKKGSLESKSMEPENTWEMFEEFCRIKLW